MGPAPVLALAAGLALRAAPPAEPVEVLDMAEVMWGRAVPNAVGALALAWDPDAGVLYHSGELSGRIGITRPADGHPSAAIDLELGEAHPGELLLDRERRLLVWSARDAEVIRVVDLESGRVLARLDGGAGGPRDAALDPASGWIWVADPARRELRGYAPDLSRSVVLPGLRRPVAVEAAPRGDGLLIADAGGYGRFLRYVPSTGAFEVLCRFTARDALKGTPRQVAFLGETDILVAARRIVALAPDCRSRWRVTPTAPPRTFAHVGNLVAIVQEWSRDAPRGVLTLVDDAVGRPVARHVALSYLPRSAAVDPAGRRIFVSNAGDGSAEVLSVSDRGVVGRIDLARSVEDVAVDPLRGARFLLDRLGGNTLFRWTAAGALAAVGEAPWPVELAVDVDRRHLVAAVQFLPELRRWDLDTGEALPPVRLGGMPADRTEVLADLALDPATGVAAVVHPGTGWLALGDLRTGRARWAAELPWLRSGRAPAWVAVDRRRVIVVGGNPPRIALLDRATGQLVVRVRVPRRLAGALDGRVRDRLVLADGRAFLGGMALDADTLAPAGWLGQVDVVVSPWDGIALSVEGGAAVLVRFDPDTLRVRERRPLVPVGHHPVRARWDPAARRLYLLDAAEARVLAFEVAP